eukprot:662459-Pyramimonas_sp.AAC.1
MKGKIGGKQGGKGGGSWSGSYGGQGRFTRHSERECCKFGAKGHIAVNCPGPKKTANEVEQERPAVHAESEQTTSFGQPQHVLSVEMNDE